MIEHSNNSTLAGPLIAAGVLTAALAHGAYQTAAQQKLPYVSYLVEEGLVTDDVIQQTCQQAFALPIFDLHLYDMDWFHHSPLTVEHIQRYHAVPLHYTDHLLHIGLADPTDQQALDAITFHTGLPTSPVIVSEKKLNQLIAKLTANDRSFQPALLKKISAEDLQPAMQRPTDTHDGALIQLVDQIVQRAMQQSASDIHIEPNAASCRIRYRRDGLLYEITQLPFDLAARLVARLKVIAKLDIAERRLPQDGRFQRFNCDIRINTCPTLFGEKVVLRLLNATPISLEIDRLGFNDTQKKLFLQKISQPCGMILVTGPTGSGKTMTLYAALNYLNSTEKNISTVEDPIEIQLPGINQVNVCPKVQLDFAVVLRALLRQDPDVIMVGEIRDKETAEIALQAAQTGHLVLSTLHTTTARETIARLSAMGIAPYQIGSAISLIVAQRLVRKLCPQCKTPDKAPLHLQKKMGDDVPIFRAQGCRECLQGYQGRTGIYELLPLNENIAGPLLSPEDLAQWYIHFRQDNMMVLQQSAIEKVIAGTTSMAEIDRVLI